MRYFYIGNIRKLRENGFVVHNEKNKQWTYANRGYETDRDNSILIWLGNNATTPYTKNEIVFNIGGKNKDDLPDYIEDLIAKGLVMVKEDDDNKSN
jgi:hypothetical protein